MVPEPDRVCATHRHGLICFRICNSRLYQQQVYYLYFLPDDLLMAREESMNAYIFFARLAYRKEQEFASISTRGRQRGFSAQEDNFSHATHCPVSSETRQPPHYCSCGVYNGRICSDDGGRTAQSQRSDMITKAARSEVRPVYTWTPSDRLTFSAQQLHDRHVPRSHVVDLTRK